MKAKKTAAHREAVRGRRQRHQRPETGSRLDPRRERERPCHASCPEKRSCAVLNQQPSRMLSKFVAWFAIMRARWKLAAASCFRSAQCSCGPLHLVAAPDDLHLLAMIVGAGLHGQEPKLPAHVATELQEFCRYASDPSESLRAIQCAINANSRRSSSADPPCYICPSTVEEAFSSLGLPTTSPYECLAPFRNGDGTVLVPELQIAAFLGKYFSGRIR